MITLQELRERTTISVPEAGRLLGVGKDSAYAAAERGEIPVLHLGRRLRVPVPRLLELLGANPSAQADAGPTTEPASATTTSSAKEVSDHGDPQTHAQSSNLRVLHPR